jgi:hypothetical protein
MALVLDGMPAEEKRRRFAELVSQMVAERFPEGGVLRGGRRRSPVRPAASSASAYKAEAAGDRAWVARPHGPERTEVWDRRATSSLGIFRHVAGRR